MTDLFAQEKTKKDQILDFIREKTWVRTSEIIAFGSRIYYNRAERTARDLATEGQIRRMPEELKKLRFKETREEIWEII